MFNYRKHRATLPRESRRTQRRCHTRTAGTAIDNMSHAELRGYVRAFALPCVCEEALQLVSREWPRKAFNELVAAALEQATHMVIVRLKTSPIVSDADRRTFACASPPRRIPRLATAAASPSTAARFAGAGA